MSLGSKGITPEHMVFLAGRKEYLQHHFGSSDLSSLNEGNLSLPEESLERVLSTSMSMSIDETGSVHSYSSEASEMSSHIDAQSQSSFSKMPVVGNSKIEPFSNGDNNQVHAHVHNFIKIMLFV